MICFNVSSNGPNNGLVVMVHTDGEEGKGRALLLKMAEMLKSGHNGKYKLSELIADSPGDKDVIVALGYQLCHYAIKEVSEVCPSALFNYCLIILCGQ